VPTPWIEVVALYRRLDPATLASRQLWLELA
jgi:hypothetical protein